MNKATTSLVKEVVRLRANTGNAEGCFAGTFRVRSLDLVSGARRRVGREASRMPASARQSQNVPASYPRRIKISPSRATQHARLQGFSSSPLTDSNRRPLLTMEVLRRYSRTRAVICDHVCPANRYITACRPCTRVPARVQADVPVSYPRCVVCSQNTRRPLVYQLLTS
jgi:hypothetical protein